MKRESLQPQYLAAPLAALLSAAIASVKLSSAALWTDELATWSASTRSIDKLFALVENRDITHVAYYLLMHVWVEIFGTSEIALRAPSVIAVGAAAAFIVLIVQRLTGAWQTALFAGVLFSVLPSVSRYGQEARVYAIVLALAAAATWGMLRAREHPSWGRWVVYVLLIVLLGWAHFLALLVLAAHGLGVWDRGTRVRIRWALSVAVAGVCVAPVLWGALTQRGINDWIDDPSWPDTINVWNEVLGTAVVAGGVLILAVVGAITAFTAFPRDVWWLVVWAVTGPVLLFLAGNITASLWNPRYLLYTLPAFVILAAYALHHLSPPPRAWPAVLLIATLTFLGLPEQQSLRRPDAHARMDGHAAAQFIAEHAQDGDAIAYPAKTDVWAPHDMIAYYLPRVLPEDKHPRELFVEKTAVDAGQFEPVLCSGLAECESDTKGVQRIWVVRWGAYNLDPLQDFGNETTEALLRERYDVSMIQLTSPEVTVSLLVAKEH